MKKTEYFCDICRDKVRDQEGKEIRPSLAFEFSLDNSAPQFVFRTKVYHQAERHICQRCLGGLVSLAKGCPKGWFEDIIKD